ncbi:MAG: aminotransferase class I/II-fold pyridoxal phosphate-dependent enzyme, partial [Opitutae bacterium]
MSNREPYFEDIPDRRDTNSLKWGKYSGRDVIPLWVADMDFKSPPGVVERAAAEADFGHSGSAKSPACLVEVISEGCKDLYGWEIESSWIVWLPGMVCALNVSCRVFEKESSQVFTQTPVYPPFLSAPGNFDLPCTRVPMVLDQGRFGIDFDALVALPSNPSDLFMLCHPHNPVGSAFTKEELAKFAEWACRKDLYVCSDEIHCDLLLEPGLKHTPLASLGAEVADRSITLMAPSKTYNLPGFGCSYAIISNGKLRSRFKKAMAGIVPDPPAMGFALAESGWFDIVNQVPA